MRAIVSVLASVSVFALLVAAWWFYWPVWQVEFRVKNHLQEPRFAMFSGVTYNKNTATGCGYVNGDSQRGRTHFILLPDGDVKFDPRDAVRGSTLQQLEGVRKHADYLALVYNRCSPG